MKKLTVSCTIISCLAMASSAEAAHWDVWFNSATPILESTQDQTEAAIQTVLRGWENNSQGSANFRWMGSSPTVTCSPGRLIIKVGTLPNGTLAYNDPVALAGGCMQLTFRQGWAFRTRLHPSLLGTLHGLDFHAILNHEIGHYYTFVPNEHGFNTVRLEVISGGLVGQDFLGRHHWNKDMFDAPGILRPSRQLGFQVSDYNSVSMQESNTQSGVGTGSMIMPTAAISSGVWSLPNEPYAWAWAGENNGGIVGDPSGIFFRTGTALNAPVFATGLNTHEEHRTRHPMCLASDSANEYIMVWTSKNETPPYAVGNSLWSFSGSRGVWMTRSFDRGRTWSTPTAFDDGSTRAGIACNYDPIRGRFVVVFTGSQDEGLWLKHSSVGGNVWSVATMLGPVAGDTVTPTTMETPTMDFDTNGTGLLAWYDNVNGSRSAELAWTGAGYTWSAALPDSPTFTTQSLFLRSRMAILRVGNERQTSFDINITAQWNWHYNSQLTPRIENITSMGSVTFRQRASQFARSAYSWTGATRLLSVTWTGAE